MTTIRLSGAVLAPGLATIRLSGAELGPGAGGDVTVRLSGAVLGPASLPTIDDDGAWLRVGDQWRPFELWIDVPD